MLPHTLAHIRILQLGRRNRRLDHQWLPPKHHPHQPPHNRSCHIPIIPLIPPSLQCIITPIGMDMADGITRQDIKMGAGRPRARPPWMGSPMESVNPLLEVTPRKGPYQHEQLSFRFRLRVSFFSVS